MSPKTLKIGPLLKALRHSVDGANELLRVFYLACDEKRAGDIATACAVEIAMLSRYGKTREEKREYLDKVIAVINETHELNDRADSG